MLFAQYERYQYARPPLVEVICQLRFPTILAIGAQDLIIVVLFRLFSGVLRVLPAAGGQREQRQHSKQQGSKTAHNGMFLSVEICRCP